MQSLKEQRAQRHDRKMLIYAAIGFGCMIAYSRMLGEGFEGFMQIGSTTPQDTFYLLRSFARLFTVAIIAIGGYRQEIRINGIAVVAAGVLMTFSTAIFTFSGDGSLGALVALMAGASNGILLYAWMLLLSSYDMKHIMKVTLIGLVIAGIILGGSPYLPTAPQMAVVILSAMLSSFSMLAVDPEFESCVPDGKLTRADLRQVPWFTFIMIIVCGSIGTVLYGMATEFFWSFGDETNYAAFGISIVLTIAATVFIMLRAPLWADRVWLPTFILLMCSLCSCFFVADEIMPLCMGFLLASMFCYHFLHWMIFPAIFHEMKVPRHLIIGVVLVLTNSFLVTHLGGITAHALPESLSSLSSVAGLMAVGMIILFAVSWGFVGRTSNQGETSRIEGIAEESFEQMKADNPELAQAGEESTDEVEPAVAEAQPEPEPEPAPVPMTIEERFEEIGKQYGLTAREKEIAALTAQGFSSTYIAEKLVVSASTVRFHQQNVYRKLDIHSRTELIEIANAQE